ncbi:Ribonuclease HI [Achromobacter sp. 2789STDY5608633]|jgi:ribonuclease HI|uniref:ribonuclease HI n=1 Tax=Achromobacter sp. 2789STDY5608633 TaxID=1806501 RepID=UPI0006C22708|nr:ribonuclease HI [Achromobacter sp. 2789STDY5608633]CUJ49157.1 Ribonuclease HI [Achromobacter sp. 2789STDY5608633]
MPVQVFCDGSCLKNPGGPGAWAAVIIYPDGARMHIAQPHSDTTNNRMELSAAINGLRALEGETGVVDLFVDSQYVLRGATEWLPGWKRNGWRTREGGEVKNVDLWMELDAAMRELQVRWTWVRGHAGHENNELADQLAKAAARTQEGTQLFLRPDDPMPEAPDGAAKPKKGPVDLCAGWSDAQLAAAVRLALGEANGKIVRVRERLRG